MRFISEAQVKLSVCPESFDYAQDSCRLDKRSASTVPVQKGGCAALIHPTLFAENNFTLEVNCESH